MDDKKSQISMAASSASSWSTRPSLAHFHCAPLRPPPAIPRESQLKETLRRPPRPRTVRRRRDGSYCAHSLHMAESNALTFGEGRRGRTNRIWKERFFFYLCPMSTTSPASPILHVLADDSSGGGGYGDSMEEASISSGIKLDHNPGAKASISSRLLLGEGLDSMVDLRLLRLKL